MLRDDYRMSCEENGKWQSERPVEDKCPVVIETQLRLSYKQKARNIPFNI